MGFLKPKLPKPDPALAAAQARETERAKRDRIGLISEQLDDETRARIRRYGRMSQLSGNGASGVLGALGSQSSGSAGGGQGLGLFTQLLRKGGFI